MCEKCDDLKQEIKTVREVVYRLEKELAVARVVQEYKLEQILKKLESR